MVQLTEETIKDFIKDGKVVIKVWSKDCGWCDKQKPVFEQVASEFPDIKFGDININYTKPNTTPQQSDFRKEYLDNHDGAPILVRFQDGARTHIAKKAILSADALKKFILGEYKEEPKQNRDIKTVHEFELKARAFDLQSELNMIYAELGRRQNA